MDIRSVDVRSNVSRRVKRVKDRLRRKNKAKLRCLSRLAQSSRAVTRA